MLLHIPSARNFNLTYAAYMSGTNPCNPNPYNI